jgi:Asp-tRNA(Asn)/Glu-tRNA(Gln) amidotransferase C subunit
MVVTQKEFQEIIKQLNDILTKLDERLKKLETAPVSRTTKTTKSQEKDLTNE